MSDGMTSIIIGAAFLIIFLATFSTEQPKRRIFMVTYGCVFVAFVFLTIINGGSVLSELTKVQYFLALGLILPQLLARFYVQRRIRSPFEFVYQNFHVRWMIALVVLAGIIIYYISSTISSIVSYKTGQGMYTNDEVQYKLSFVITLIMVGLSLLSIRWQRSAFCANGLLNRGVLWDWSQFKSYEWENEEIYLDPDASRLLDQNTLIGLMLYPKTRLTFPHVRLHYTVPYRNKEAIDRILKQALSS